MKNLNSVVAGAVLAGGTLLAGPAIAGWSGNVGVVSDYMFRGVSQTGGDAVQGGLDYEAESGFYFGTWASNINFAGGTEQDIYVGYGFEAGDIGIDVSALYYWYPEEDEGNEEWSTAEFGLGLSFGPMSLGVALSPENNFIVGDGQGEETLYLSIGGSFPVSDKLTFDVSLGQFSGDEIERSGLAGAGEDSYIDLMFGLSAELDAGFSATFQYITTDIDDDDPKFVLGLAKGFDL